MLRALRHMLARVIAPLPSSGFRSLDAATGTRRGWGMGHFGSINIETPAALGVAVPRARYLAANNAFINNAVGNIVGSLIGPGILPKSKHPDPAVRTRLDGIFADWSEDADIAGRANFEQMQAEIARALVVDGESFVQILDTPDGPRLKHVPTEQIDAGLTREIDSTRAIVQGVEIDLDMRRLAFWALPANPTGMLTAVEPVRIPAEQMLHIMKPIAPAQVRGLTWLAPIVLPASDLDQTLDALLMGVKVAALNCAIFQDVNGTAVNPFEGKQTGPVLEASLEPGVGRFLPPGWTATFNTPSQTQQVGTFLKTELHQLAAGLGIPTHLADNDLSSANYSSLRAGLLPFRQRCEQTQYGVLVPQLLNRVWRAVVIHAALAGDLPGFDADPRDFFRVDWIMPKPIQVDPLKQVQADVAEIEAGLTSRTKAIAERGWIAEELDNEIAADRQRAEGLGLSFGAKPAAQQQGANNAG